MFRPLNHMDHLTEEELEEFKDFARALANTRTLEMVDVQLAWLILRDLYYISWTRSTCFRVPFSMRNLT